MVDTKAQVQHRAVQIKRRAVTIAIIEFLEGNQQVKERTAAVVIVQHPHQFQFGLRGNSMNQPRHIRAVIGESTVGKTILGQAVNAL